MWFVPGGESSSAPAEGLQEAPGQPGGVLAEHKTDSLRAAWKQQGEDGRRKLTERSSGVMSCPRVRPEKGKTWARCIDFQHVIDSLAKKPGAFCHATLRNDTLPDDAGLGKAIWHRG